MIRQYNYRSCDRNLEFDEVVTILKKRNPKNPIRLDWPSTKAETDDKMKIIDFFISHNTQFEYLKVEKAEYDDYLKEAGYKILYPKYYSDNFIEKTFEHFIGYKLLKLRSGDNFIDIACESSPVAEIYKKLTNCNSFMQDIMFEKGIHRNRIGSNANHIPIPDNFFQGALVACSIEHFEKNDDIGFMKECARILYDEGRVVILPLYINSYPFYATDPRYSVPGKVHFERKVEIRCIKGYGNRHARFYSPETLYQRLIKPNLAKMRFKVYYIENYHEIDLTIYCKYVLVGEKISKNGTSLKRRIGSRPLLIWGTGSGGSNTLKMLREEEYHIKGFIDNNSAKWGELYMDLPVYSPEALKGVKGDDRPYIIIGSTYADEIKRQLVKLGYQYGKDFK